MSLPVYFFSGTVYNPDDEERYLVSGVCRADDAEDAWQQMMQNMMSRGGPNASQVGCHVTTFNRVE